MQRRAHRHQVPADLSDLQGGATRGREALPRVQNILQMIIFDYVGMARSLSKPCTSPTRHLPLPQSQLPVLIIGGTVGASQENWVVNQLWSFWEEACALPQISTKIEVRGRRILEGHPNMAYSVRFGAS